MERKFQVVFFLSLLDFKKERNNDQTRKKENRQEKYNSKTKFACRIVRLLETAQNQ